MAYALIDPFSPVIRVQGWDTVEGQERQVPNTAVLEGKHTITQIEDATFEMCSPFHWVECNSSVTTDDYYYDPVDSTIKPKNNVADPNPPTPDPA
jgi:hypothetical protein